MRKLVVLGSALVLLCGVSGCGSNPDNIVKEQITAMNDLADALENKALDASVAELQKRLEDINKKLEALELSDEEKKKLADKHEHELINASTRLTKVGMNRAITNLQGLFGGQLLVIPEKSGTSGSLKQPDAKLKASLVGKWNVNRLPLEFRGDGTFDEEVEIKTLQETKGGGREYLYAGTKQESGVYEWVDDRHIEMRRPGAAARKVKVVIMGEDLTLIGENTEVMRGKRSK